MVFFGYKKWKKYFFWGLALFLLLIIACNGWVIISTQSRVFSNSDKLPYNEVALVLGTSNKLMSGEPNPFFVNRMEKAAQLFKQGKVRQFILSGDNRTVFYNEPGTMKKALIEMGVPDSLITLDTAGLRTLDSIIRSKLVFGINRLTIITQPFHSYRALFLSDYFDIDAVAMAAPEPGEKIGLQVYLREYFARAKAMLDVYILKTKPESLLKQRI